MSDTEYTIGIVMSIVIVVVVGFVLIAPRDWIARLLGEKKKDE